MRTPCEKKVNWQPLAAKYRDSKYKAKGVGPTFAYAGSIILGREY